MSGNGKSLNKTVMEINIMDLNILDFEGLKVTMRNDIHDFNVLGGAIDTLKKSNIENIDIVVDIGTHCGGLSLYSAKRGAKRVFAFEAAPINYFHLVNNIFLNCFENVIIPYNLAVSNVTGDLVTMHMSDEDWSLNASKYATFGHHFTTHTISFEKILNNLSHIDYLKIDVEGMEFEFICKTPNIRTLLRKVRFIDLEVHADQYLGVSSHNSSAVDLREDMVQLFESCGFNLEDYGDIAGFNKRFQKLGDYDDNIKIVH